MQESFQLAGKTPPVEDWDRPPAMFSTALPSLVIAGLIKTP
jgi:hypothetical protein